MTAARRRALIGLSACAAMLFAPARALAQRRVSVFRVELGNGGALTFVGTAHTNAPDDPQVPQIREHFASSDPELVLVEGGRWPVLDDPIEALRRHGEMAFVVSLAHHAGKPVEDLDPDFSDEIRHVVVAHGADRAKLFYVLRTVPQYVRAHEQGASSLAESISRRLDSAAMRSIGGTTLPIASLTDLQTATERWLPQLGDWRGAADTDLWSGRRRTWLADVQATSTAFRDEHMLRRIAAELKRGRKLFVIAGGDHLDTVRSRLRTALAAP